MAKASNDREARAALEKHAGKRDTIKFTEEVRPDKLRFFAGTVVKFADPAMAAYFDAAFNGTEFTTEKPNVTIGPDELDFGDPHDPDTPGNIDPNAVVGRGRQGVEPGTTIIEHLTGKPGKGRVAIEPKDSTTASGAEG